VWSVFGAAAITGDTAIHRLAGEVSWIAQHPWVVSGAVLVLAGAFQFSSLKDKCLTQCRAPAPSSCGSSCGESTAPSVSA
jgi:predicted metal-binding membrane protein